MKISSFKAAEIKRVSNELKNKKHITCELPGKGKIHIDRLLPFLFVYRIKNKKDKTTKRLLNTEASFLIAPLDKKYNTGINKLVCEILEILNYFFGRVCLIEIWSCEHKTVFESTRRSFFRFVYPSQLPLDVIDAFTTHFGSFLLNHQAACLEKKVQELPSDVDSAPLLKTSQLKKYSCYLIGLEFFPVYLHSSAKAFPLLFRRFRSQLSIALRKSAYLFAINHSNYNPSSFLALGKHKLNKMIYRIDKQLTDVSEKFDFLLYITPTNAENAWEIFKKSQYENLPPFCYRPLPFDPYMLKRKLYKIPIEKIADPAIERLFRLKQFETDKKLEMLLQRETSIFMFGSLQLYGSPSEKLKHYALAILKNGKRENTVKKQINAETFAKKAEKEVAFYQSQNVSLSLPVELREDIFSILVSQGKLLIGKGLKVDSQRVEALIHHEVGTHLVTYINGYEQPLRLLREGLANYEETQEGLAVFAEYLVGGLNMTRLRTLAARVLIADCLVRKKTFVESFHLLVEKYGFDKKSAFGIVLRIYRGGGFTKDMIYLRGFMQVIDYIEQGKPLDLLFSGKIALGDFSIIRELTERGIVLPPKIYPRYLEFAKSKEKIAAIRQKLSIKDIVSEAL